MRDSDNRAPRKQHRASRDSGLGPRASREPGHTTGYRGRGPRTPRGGYDDTAGEPGRLVLLEINTQPGLTPTSLLPEQAAHMGMSFPRLCAWMVENASCRV